MPGGAKVPPKRGVGSGGAFANGTSAGTIESSKGSASATPAPRRTERREMCFLSISIGLRLSFILCQATGLRRLSVHFEGSALDDAHHQRNETIIAGRRAPYDRAHHRHVLTC